MPPLHLLIKPASSLCNLRCGYCFYSDVAENRAVPCYGRMTDDTLEATVRRAFEYADGHISFAFQGGEPTLVGLDFYK
ncbi:MAG: anaerobic sulfatase maturase, partial [Clostridia bacterium]|nr:anaerobic sulfatase maturase [Clostridia bacterium]